MKIIHRFDSNNVDEVRTELEKAFEAFFQHTGVKLSMGKITYGSTEFNCKLTALVVDLDNEEDANTPARLLKYKKDFVENCWKYGLKADELGTKKSIAGSRYTLLGCSTKSSKYPLICKKSDGKTIKLTAAYWKSGKSYTPAPVDNIDSFL